MDEVIHIENLSKTFGNFKAVDNLSLTMRSGEIFGLIGPNGSGKTTTISILMNILSPDEGSVIRILNKDVSKNMAELYPQIGFMPQELSLYIDLTIVQNLNYFGKLYDIPKSELKIRVEEMLNLVGLKEFRKRLISECSGGMQRRASLAVALLHKPKILIIDEPTVGVDPALRIEFWSYFKKIVKEKGVSILITTHYLAESMNCDRIGLINKKIFKIGTPKELQEQVKKEENLSELPDMEEVFIFYTKKYSILEENLRINGSGMNG